MDVAPNLIALVLFASAPLLVMLRIGKALKKYVYMP